MDSTRRPDKKQVRDWLAMRRASRSPPPDIEEIRVQLGWSRQSVKTEIASRKA